jgi:hypothetical protein
MVRTQIQLTEDQAKTLKRLAHSIPASGSRALRFFLKQAIRTSPGVGCTCRRETAAYLLHTV